MIAHDGQRLATIDHRPHDVQHLANLWSSVNEITEEDHFALGVFVNALDLLIAECIQELNQFVGMTVNVADQIVHSVRVT